MGIGYFYQGLSNDFKNLTGRLLPLRDMQGGEVYYNAEITPWFHLTADLQVVEPANQDYDTAVVLGLRGKIDHSRHRWRGPAAFTELSASSVPGTQTRRSLMTVRSFGSRSKGL